MSNIIELFRETYTNGQRPLLRGQLIKKDTQTNIHKLTQVFSLIIVDGSMPGLETVCLRLSPGYHSGVCARVCVFAKNISSLTTLLKKKLNQTSLVCWFPSLLIKSDDQLNRLQHQLH